MVVYNMLQDMRHIIIVDLRPDIINESDKPELSNV
jgi:hypothetical protein